MEERLHFNHMWTDPFTKSSGKSHALLFQTPANFADTFAWPYTGIAFTHVIHILHILWGVWVVALLKPSRDSGMQVGSHLILMPKEPTRLNMAPRSLFGMRVFVQRSKIQLVSQTEPKFLCERKFLYQMMLSLTLWKYGHEQMHSHVLTCKGQRQTLFTTFLRSEFSPESRKFNSIVLP